jgi:hypothetical protein
VSESFRAEAGRILQRSVIGTQTAEAGALSRIAQLQLENARLRKLVTDLLLEKMRLENGQAQLSIGVGMGPLIGVRPKRWTVSCGCFDRLPGVVILELCWA